eukprot:11173717-Lingulodinium_polyedra.AAC.1
MRRNYIAPERKAWWDEDLPSARWRRRVVAEATHLWPFGFDGSRDLVAPAETSIDEGADSDGSSVESDWDDGDMGWSDTF